MFGNAVTAANAVGKRLSGIIHQFVGVIIPVIQPAMTANTGANKTHVTHRLITATSALATAIAIPIITTIFFDAHSLLNLWLSGNVPPMAETFAQLAAILGSWLLFSKGHELALHATGEVGILVGIYHLIGTSVFAVGAFATYFFFQGYPWMLKVFELVGVGIAALVWQPYWVSKKLGAPLKNWFRNTLLPSAIIIVASLIVGLATSMFMEPSFQRAIVIGSISSMVSIITTWWVAFSETERDGCLTAIKNIATSRNSKT